MPETELRTLCIGSVYRVASEKHTKLPYAVRSLVLLDRSGLPRLATSLQGFRDLLPAFSGDFVKD